MTRNVLFTISKMCYKQTDTKFKGSQATPVKIQMKFVNLMGGWTGLLLGTYRGCLSTWGPVAVSCSWALGYPFLWGLGWGDLVGDWSGWTPHHNVGSKYIFGLFTLKILVTCREGKWGLLGKNIGDTYSFGVVMWSDVSKKTWVLYPRHEIFNLRRKGFI